MFKAILLVVCVVFVAISATAQVQFATDTIATSGGDLKITFIGHGSLIFSFKGKVIHVDPYGTLADYSKLPKADIILITHDHPDHFDPQAIAMIRATTNTELVFTKTCAEKLAGGIVMKNGDVQTVQGLKIEAVPAYNIVHKRGDGQPFHLRGVGNGYIVTFGDKRIYIAGDTENIPEMKALQKIDIAFLPMNLPYTMTPEMVADAAKVFKPKILYPYHYGDTDTSKIVAALQDVKGIDVRIRTMK
jgi:L-ascorbate metabolism protein UlaG (beta-lactamase superfamily)